MYMNPSIQPDDIIDIAVTFDGSWQKRGHSSHYGLGAVIELETGLVLDYEAYSLYCHVSWNFYLEILLSKLMYMLFYIYSMYI